MKHFFTILVAGLISQTVAAQVNADPLALVRQNRERIGLTEADIANSSISSAYYVSETNINMVYLQQTYMGMPVFNKMHTLAFRNGTAVSVAGERVADIAQKAVPQDGQPALPAQAAVQTALTESNVSAAQALVPLSVSDNGRRIDFGQLGISRVNVVATLLWAPDDAGMVQLVWQVELAPKNSSDHWLIRINAASNKVLEKNNYTVYCSWNGTGNTQACSLQHHHGGIPQQDPQEHRHENRQPFLINGATYKVVPFPAESPQHPGGALANRTDPWLLAPAGSNATTLKWHSTGTTDYTITRGNNVWAYEDRNADNIAGAADTSTTADPLTFTKTYDFAQEPVVNVNQRAATTNLFYWNNIIHDIAYLYGLNEVAGNFQVNNQGRGGAGNDAVNAEAQDGAGSNNANFSTPVDGSPGRMQMFLWTAPTPDRDGDLDNGIIIHEYGHGISNRFTGGPANSSCLGNQEQMGEGWSDYLGLMLTQDWANSLVTDGFNKPRGIGTYALNQPITGVGIRQYPYTTNMTVNPFTYTNITSVAVPHGVGSVWCTMLWDMTWDMIQLDGINPDIYNVSGTGGNIAALRLVMEGMRLQPCNPGFVDGRNAILRADTLLYGARYSCIIWKAFARRGLGFSASQGLSTSRSDQTPAFDEPNYLMTFTPNVTQQAQGQNIVYTLNTRSLCLPISNFKIVDTLPLNVTHISGGTYNAGNRTVTFAPVTLAQGASQTNSFTVQVNPGSYFPPVQHINEQVTGTAIPAAWAAASTTAANWRVSAAQSFSAPRSFFTPDTSITSDQTLTTQAVTISGSTTLSFQHNYNTESTWDGAVVEITTNNGTTWTDLGNFFITGGYNATLNSTGTNPIRGRRAFSGNSGGFRSAQIDLNSFSGQTIRIRFRFGSDGTTGGTGWYVDDVQLTSEAAVITQASLFNAADVAQLRSTIITRILPPLLPLSLTSFGGYLQQQDALLQWQTGSEINTDVFDIERSFDGNRYSAAGQVRAASNASGARYAFTDAAVLGQSAYKGVVYYRLKMKDRDGSFTYSKVVRLSSKGAGLLTISPNPVKDQLNISGFKDNRIYDMTISDLSGKILQTGKLSFVNNRLDVSGLAAGVYMLSVQTGSGTDVYRFVKE